MDTTRVSLIERANDGSTEAWQRLDLIYRPLIFRWLRRYSLQEHDADDLAQDVMGVLMKEFARFEHPGTSGAFRAWLRTITANRARSFLRSRKSRPTPTGSDDFAAMLDQLEEPASEISAEWDREHDRYLVRRLLELMEGEFEPQTLQAFRRHVIDGKTPQEVAAELGIKVRMVYVAKSRVLRRLREEASGLIDEWEELADGSS